MIEYKEFVYNQMKENTKYNAKIAIAKYYQQKYNELKQKSVRKNAFLTTQSVCVKYVREYHLISFLKLL